MCAFCHSFLTSIAGGQRDSCFLAQRRAAFFYMWKDLSWLAFVCRCGILIEMGRGYAGSAGRPFHRFLLEDRLARTAELLRVPG